MRRRRLAYRPELYDQIAPGYYDDVYRRGRGVQSYWHRSRFATVESHLPRSPERILDVGCGPGTFLGNLGVHPGYALGVDIAADQIEYARGRYARPGVEFQVGDATQLESRDSFDAITTIELIEHLPADQTATFLRGLRALLRPGGTIVVTTPNYRSAWPLLERLVSRLGPVDYREQHITRFNPARLTAALSDAGFVDVHCATFFLTAPFVAALSSSLAERVDNTERKLFGSLGYELVATARRF